MAILFIGVHPPFRGYCSAEGVIAQAEVRLGAESVDEPGGGTAAAVSWDCPRMKAWSVSVKVRAVALANGAVFMR